jgi:GNAT superfamily N-acetyltransferase
MAADPAPPLPQDRPPDPGPRRLHPGDPGLADVRALLGAAFAYMEGVIDPPSSLARLSAEGLAGSGEVWVIGAPPLACVVLTPMPHALYLGKLAVAEGERGKGHARTLIALAEDRARALGLGVLELQTRVELVANHAAFAALGFAKVAETAHQGYDRPTSITMHKQVGP